MRWLISRLIVITTILLVLVGLAMITGRVQPIPPRIAILHLDQCQLPCWIGIIPGKTTIAEAQDRVKQVYANLPIEYDDSYLLIGSSDLQLRVAFNENNYEYTPDATVEYISLFEYENQTDITDFPIAEIYNQFGQPDQLAEWGAEGTAFPMLQYSAYHSILGFGPITSPEDQIPSCTRPEPQWTYLGLEIFNQLPNGFFQPQPWHGFDTCYNLGIQNP